MQKLTPKNKKEIAVRAALGERQKDLAKEYDVSDALISRVVKQSREQSELLKETNVPLLKKNADISGKTDDQLQNRYRMIHKELLQCDRDIKQRQAEAEKLKKAIERESQKPDGVCDESWILVQMKRLTWCEDTKQIAYEMARLYQEGAGILEAFGKRNISVPYLDFL